MNIHQLDTPALILDKKLFEHNRRTMKELIDRIGMQLRPHYKSHKCPTIAALQIQDGAKGITCAKLGEAMDLAAAGIQDILIANQIVQPEKMPRLAQLASECRLTLCVDNAENVLMLEEQMALRDSVLYCLVEYEVGMHRCGVDGHDEVLALARLIQQQPHLRFEGIQAYAGQMSHETDFAARQQTTEWIEKDLTELKQKLTAAGLKVKEISGGSTGMIELKPGNSVYTEMQCGSYLFMDQSYRRMNLCFANSLFLLTSVVSTKADRIVTDGGVKSLGMDQGGPVVIGWEEAPLQMSEEHATISCANHTCRLNDKIRYIPGHCCTTFNMHDYVYVVEDDEVVDKWPIISRGKSY